MKKKIITISALCILVIVSLVIASQFRAEPEKEFTIELTVPSANVERVVTAFTSLYPIPEECEKEVCVKKFTNKEWIEGLLQRWISFQVHQYENDSHLEK